MKYNKGFASLILVAIIVGALVIGGGVYYIGKSKGEDKKVEENQNVENQETDNSENTKGVDQVNKNIEKKGIKTQVNVNAGYQVDYPSDWYVESSDTKMSSSGYNSFIIENTKDAVLPGSDFSLKTNGTQIQISVNTNMNYSNYEEFIKDPKTDLPKSAKDQRLAGLEMINIGGKTLQAFTGLKVPASTTTGKLYNFIYNNKQYSINIISGSEEQFTKDKKVFEDMVSSFKFLDFTESITWKKSPKFGLYYSSSFTKPSEFYRIVNKNNKNFLGIVYEPESNTVPVFGLSIGNGADINWGDVWERGFLPGICNESTFGNFEYGISGTACIKGYRAWVSHASAGDTITKNELKIFGDFVLKNIEDNIKVEVFKNQPGKIKSVIYNGLNKWILGVDLLTINPNWHPENNDRYLNENTKIRNLNINSGTIFLNCHDTNPEFVGVETNSNLLDFINYIKTKNDYIAYFDIFESNITAIYEQCLP